MLTETAPISGFGIASPPEGRICLPTVMGIVRELGRVCRELREARYGKDGGWLEVGVHISKRYGQDKRSLKKFENGEPVDFVDEKVSAYAQACGVTLAEIVDRIRPELSNDLQLPEADDPAPETPHDDSGRTGLDSGNPPAASEGSAR